MAEQRMAGQKLKDSLTPNKPRRTPDHPTKSHVVLAKEGDKEKLIRFGQQGVEGAGKNPTSAKDKARKKSYYARHNAQDSIQAKCLLAMVSQSEVVMAYTVQDDGFYHIPIIDLGERLRDNFGLTIREHEHFDPVDPVHAPNSYHKYGYAIDVQDWRPDIIDGVDWKTRTKNLEALLQGSGAEIYGPNSGCART